MTSNTNNNDSDKKKVIVLGAGVEGLTTALKVKEKWGAEVEVEIIADVLPTDPKTTAVARGVYTSHWAGAHYVTTRPPGTREGDIARATFREMWALSEPGSPAEKCFLRIVQSELYAKEEEEEEAKEEAKEGGPEPSPSPFAIMPEFRELPKTEFPPTLSGVSSGFSFRTVTIDVPVYLDYLTDRLVGEMGEGVRFVRGHVLHIQQVLEGGSRIFKEDHKQEHDPNVEVKVKVEVEVEGEDRTPPDAVILCVGLGARFLGGVEDKSVYASRGQTVILRAPWVRFGRTFEDEVNEKWTYIIPRRGGNVVIGGIEGVDDWYPKPRPETTRDLLERGLKLCLELIPPEIRDKPGEDANGVVEDLIPLIVEEGCGLRPMRKGGPRIELEYMDVPGPRVQVTGGGAGDHERADSKERKVAVIHNYGHGTRGYIQSIGSAELVLGLLEEAFAR